MDDTTPETNPQPPPGEQPPAQAGAKRERKAPSPEAARLAAEKKRVKRKLEKLLASSDAEAISRAAQQLEAAEDGTGAERPAEAPATAALEAAAPEAKVEPAKAPSPEEVAAFMGFAGQVVAMVAAPLAGTDFDPMVERPNPVTGEPTTMASELTKALAPVLAKHLPNMVTTPEGNLALVVALWLAPATLAAVKRKAFGEGTAPANVDGAGVKAA
jgi:hypothetical protein